jgi:hypothetical protein
MQRTVRAIPIHTSPTKEDKAVIKIGLDALRLKSNDPSDPDRFRRSVQTLRHIHRRLEFTDPASPEDHDKASTVLYERATLRGVVGQVSAILDHSHPDHTVSRPPEIINVGHIDKPTVKIIQSGPEKKIKVTGFHLCPTTDPRYAQLFDFIFSIHADGPYVASFFSEMAPEEGAAVVQVKKTSTFFPSHLTKKQMIEAVGSASVRATFERRKLGLVPASPTVPVSFWIEQLMEDGMKASVYPLYFCEAISPDDTLHLIRPDRPAYSGGYLCQRAVECVKRYLEHLDQQALYAAQKKTEEETAAQSISKNRRQYQLEMITAVKKKSERKHLRVEIERETLKLIKKALRDLSAQRPTLIPQENPIRYLTEGFLGSYECVIELAPYLPDLEIAKGVFVRMTLTHLLKGLKENGIKCNTFNQKTLTVSRSSE